MTVSSRRITHQDLADAGILFVDKRQERRFLELANDKFASSVGTELVNRFRKTTSADGSAQLTDVLTFVKNNPDECAAIVSMVRKQIIREIKACRKAALNCHQNIGIPLRPEQDGIIRSGFENSPSKS